MNMPKSPTSLRLSGLARQQLDELHARLGMNQTEIVATALDRMYRQEMGDTFTEADFVKGDGKAFDFHRGYIAYGREIERVGAVRARSILIAALRRHIEKVCDGQTVDYQDKQIRLAADAFFASAHQEPYKKGEAFQ
jgi:hypothetical protein